MLWRMTEHARQRLAQRNLTEEDIVWVTRFGRLTYNSGATFYFLGRRDIPRGWERKLEHLIGTTLIVVNGWLITAYRNRCGWKKVRRKSKWREQA